MSVLAVAGATMGAHEKAKAEGAAINAERRQKIEMVKQMNYRDADLKLEQRDKYDEAMSQLTATNLAAIRNEGMVKAAIGESMLEGNSMDRVKMVTEGDTSRERAGITENYTRDYQTIFANRVGNVENTKSAIAGKQATLPTSKLAQALGIATGGAGAYVASGGKFGQGDKPANGGK